MGCTGKPKGPKGPGIDVAGCVPLDGSWVSPPLTESQMGKSTALHAGSSTALQSAAAAPLAVCHHLCWSKVHRYCRYHHHQSLVSQQASYHSYCWVSQPDVSKRKTAARPNTQSFVRAAARSNHGPCERHFRGRFVPIGCAEDRAKKRNCRQGCHWPTQKSDRHLRLANLSASVTSSWSPAVSIFDPALTEQEVTVGENVLCHGCREHINLEDGTSSCTLPQSAQLQSCSDRQMNTGVVSDGNKWRRGATCVAESTCSVPVGVFAMYSWLVGTLTVADRQPLLKPDQLVKTNEGKGGKAGSVPRCAGCDPTSSEQ